MLNEKLQPLRSVVRNSQNDSSQNSWREKNFCSGLETPLLGYGKLTVSPAYFMQLHEVSSDAHLRSILSRQLNLDQRMCDSLHPSALIQRPQVIQWLREISDFEGFLDEVLVVVHPELALICRTAQERAARDPALQKPLSFWPSLFGCIDIVVNRETPIHQDQGGTPQGYDALISLGVDHNARLELPDVGASFKYGPGCCVYLAGKVLRHGVPKWEGGERWALIHFVNDAVLDRLSTPRPSLPTLLNYLL